MPTFFFHTWIEFSFMYPIFPIETFQLLIRSCSRYDVLIYIIIFFKMHISFIIFFNIWLVINYLQISMSLFRVTNQN